MPFLSLLLISPFYPLPLSLFPLFSFLAFSSSCLFSPSAPLPRLPIPSLFFVAFSFPLAYFPIFTPLSSLSLCPLFFSLPFIFPFAYFPLLPLCPSPYSLFFFLALSFRLAYFPLFAPLPLSLSLPIPSLFSLFNYRLFNLAFFSSLSSLAHSRLIGVLDSSCLPPMAFLSSPGI